MRFSGLKPRIADFKSEHMPHEKGIQTIAILLRITLVRITQALCIGVMGSTVEIDETWIQQGL